MRIVLDAEPGQEADAVGSGLCQAVRRASAHRRYDTAHDSDSPPRGVRRVTRLSHRKAAPGNPANCPIRWVGRPGERLAQRLPKAGLRFAMKAAIPSFR